MKPVEMTPAADRAGEAAFARALELAEALRRDPDLLESRLPILQDAVDAFCDEALRGLPVACKAGCSRCCSQWVPGVKALEIERIARHVEAMGAVDEVAAVLSERVAAHDATADGDRDLAYARLGLPCVFLTADGTCGIRAHRPETCRTFFSFGPPERCAGDPESTGFQLEPHPAFGDVLARAAQPYAKAEYTGELFRDLLIRITR